MGTPVQRVIFPRQSLSSATDPDDNSPSGSQLLATLAPVALIAFIYVTLWIILRPRLHRDYAPRAYLGSLPPQERSPELPNGLFNWIGTFMKVPDTYVLNHQTFDGYLLLRYLKMSTIICLVGCLLVWPILFPINATGGGGQQQLNAISFSNIDSTTQVNRYYAHVVMACIFFSFVFYMVMRESVYYINLRQAYLLSPLYANRISSRTVLFTSVPKDYQDEARLRRMLGSKVKNVWIANDCQKIEDLVEKRDKVAMKLEGAETKLIKLANKIRLKAAKKDATSETATYDQEPADGESGSIAARWVPPNKRPTHRLRFLIGKKVDTINWCRAELQQLIPRIDALQNKVRAGEGPFARAVFVEYYTQSEAQIAFQTLAHHQPLHMAPRYIGISPDEVIWKNLNITWASRIIRNMVTTGAVVGLIIFWAIPVTFVGAVSNINSLASGDPTTVPPTAPLLPWLGFINKIPGWLLGVLQGLFPSVLLVLLMALLPVVLRFAATIAGKPSLSSVELRVQNSYFLFQVIQVFLITTFTSSAAASIVKIIMRPQDALSVLSTDLPKASNFYLSFFILQGLAISSGEVLQIVTIVLVRILGAFLDTTPRKMYNRYASLDGVSWGTLFPVYTLMTVISLTYSIIAPLVLGFATVGLYLIYLAYRYNLLYVYNSDIDTKGLVYPRALQQTTTGIYLAIVCLLGLFAVAKAWGPLAIILLYLVGAALFHVSLNQALEPLLMYLPKSLEAEEEDLLARQEAENDADPSSSNPEKGQLPTDPSSSSDPEKGQLSATNTGSTSQQPLTGPNRRPNNDNDNDNDTSHLSSSTAKVPPKTPRSFLASLTTKPTSLLLRYLSPYNYSSYAMIRRDLVSRDTFASISYSPETERDAYYNPAISSSPPVLWIPRDVMGVSRQECAHTSRVIQMTDEMAGFNEKGRMVWDKDEVGRVPVGEEKVFY